MASTDEARHAHRRGIARRQLACWTILAGSILAVWGTGAAAATTYYVRAAGSDDNDGLTPATALASVRPAARMLREPGDRLIVGPGTYHEGNISSFGNGTPEAPIVLFGDASGAMTGDPPGPVTILPTNTPAATSGFYIRGRNDIVIEGFDIEGASDAGIEVRRRRRTGVDSTRIAIRNNRVRGCRKGMQITAVGEVEVIGNHIIGSRGPEASYAGDGLLLIGAMSGPMRPEVRGNVIEDCFLGMTGTGLTDALIADNEVRSRARNLTFRGNDLLTVTGNRLMGPTQGGEVLATDLTATGNLVEPRIALGATRALDVSANTIRGYLLIRGDPQRARISQNAFSNVFIGGAGQIEIEANDGGSLQATTLTAVVATANRFAGLMRMRATDTAEASENQAGALTVGGAMVEVRRNTVANKLHLSADIAVVTDNRAGLLVMRARVVPEPDAEPDTEFVVADNIIGGPAHSLGAVTTTFHRNIIAGPLTSISRRDIDVTGNETKGIGCIALDAGARMTIVGNDSRQSAGPGLMVVGADTATIENNCVTHSAENGLAVRRTSHAVIARNDVLSNASGGVSVRVPPIGDCNEDVDVTVGDVLTMVGVGLWRRPLHDCDAADIDRDRIVTIGEIVLSVGAALGAPDARASTVELRDNRVEGNGRFGIDVFVRGSVSGSGNRVLHNGGIPLAVYGRAGLGEALLAGNVLGLGTAEGLLVEGLGAARIRDNVVFSNRDAGVLLRATPGAAVVNNLVYANGGAGVAIGVGDPRPIADALVMNNTIFANGDWGIVAGGGTAPSPGTIIRNNILDANVRGGVTAAPGALPELVVAFNINTDGYGEGVSPEPSDQSVDPEVVAPAGADGVLGDDGFADDDFHVLPTSPAIDAGSALAGELGIGGSVVAGRSVDEGVVDVGYHYGAQ